MKPDTSPTAAAAAKNIEVTLRDGDVVFHEGDETNRDMFILLDGTVEVCKGIFRLADIRGPNAYLGEMSTLLKIPRTATLFARGTCRMIRIPEDRFESFFKSRPALAVQLAEVLARRLDSMNKKYEELLRKPQASASESQSEIPAIRSASPPTTDEILTRFPGFASLAQADDGLLLTDLEAPDLTFLNGRKVAGPTKLVSGDKVQLGRHLFQYFDQHPDLVDTRPIEVAAEAEAALAEMVPRGDSPPTTEMPAMMAPVAGAAVAIEEEPIDSGVLARLDSLASAQVPPAMAEAIDRRLAVHADLEGLDEMRKEVVKGTDLPPEIESELSRQARELARMPPLANLKESLSKIQAKLLEGRKKNEERAADAPHGNLLKAMAIGYKQAQILIEREALVPAILEAARPLAAIEPLYQVLDRLGAAPQLLFGLTVYALAIRERGAVAEARLESIGKEKEDAPKKAGGFLSRGKGKGDDKDATDRLKAEEAEARRLVTRARKEVEWLEPGLVEEFWRLYEFAASALVADRVAREDEPFVRAFLRWGLVGSSPLFLEPAKVRRIVEDAARARRDWSDSTAENHVLHADEYLVAAAKGWITPSIDEDLELNQRMSPLWKADKAWRRIIHSRSIAAAYRERIADLAHRGAEARKRQAEAEAALASLDRTNPANRKREVQLKDQVQEAKVDAARFERAAERIEKELLPQALENGKSSEERLKEAGVALSQTAIARQEVAGVRRMSRLVAKLKEPYLPLELQAAWFPEREQVHDRKVVEAVMADAEARDPLLCKDSLFPVDKKAHRILLRQPPVVLIVPALGVMGFVWNPRNGPEVGRLVLPGLAPRGRMLEGMLWEALADFRYDTSKSSAGVDFLKSDTLAAAYATVRWEYRKRQKEAREKAAIYLDEKEKENFRRHYALHLKSAPDAGKLLFFKCPEVYEALLRYVDLPEGVEKLRKG